MKQTLSVAKEMVPSPTASPKATAPVVVVVCALGMALAVTSLCLLWMGYPPTTTSLGAPADSVVAERVLAVLRWYMAHAPHLVPPLLMHPVDGSPTGDLMMVETKTLFA